MINVHVPYDGEIAGTDPFLPSDNIDPTLLPADRNTPLLIYCNTGHMSSAAAVTLFGLGYTDVEELDGGMDGWRHAGRITRRDPNHASTSTTSPQADVTNGRGERPWPGAHLA